MTAIHSYGFGPWRALVELLKRKMQVKHVGSPR